MYTVRICMKWTHVCAAQTTYQFFNKLSIEPYFPCLADEIAEPRPKMNIKVAAFTVSENSILLILYTIGIWNYKNDKMITPVYFILNYA